MLRGAAAGATGTTAAAVAAAAFLNAHAVHAAATSRGSTLTEFFSILATGEALFVTFYSHAVANHEQLGINGDALTALKAIRTEEQIHLNFALSKGGRPTTTLYRLLQTSVYGEPDWQRFLPYANAVFRERIADVASTGAGGA